MNNEKEAIKAEEPTTSLFEAKQKDFLEKYGNLVKETGIDFATYPVWVPDGKGGFQTIIQSTPVDVSNQPVKSPFITQE